MTDDVVGKGTRGLGGDAGKSYPTERYGNILTSLLALEARF